MRILFAAVFALLAACNKPAPAASTQPAAD